MKKWSIWNPLLPIYIRQEKAQSADSVNSSHEKRIPKRNYFFPCNIPNILVKIKKPLSERAWAD